MGNPSTKFISKSELIEAVVSVIRINICDSLFSMGNDKRKYTIKKTRKKSEELIGNENVFPFKVTVDRIEHDFLVTNVRKKRYKGIPRIIISFSKDKRGFSRTGQLLLNQKNDSFAQIFSNSHLTSIDVLWSPYSDMVDSSAKTTVKRGRVKIVTVDMLSSFLSREKAQPYNKIKADMGGESFFKYKPEPNESNGRYTKGTLKDYDFYFSAPIYEDDPFENDISIIDEYRNEAGNFSRWLIFEYGYSVRKNELIDLFSYKQKAIMNTVCPYETNHSVTKDKDFKRLWERYCLYISRKAVMPTANFVGVYSSALTNKNILLWSNYANSHKGICLEYSLQSFVNAIEEEEHIKLVVFGNVKYSKMLPLGTNNILSLAPYLDDEMFGWILELQTIFIKFADWKFQHEYRFSIFADKEFEANGCLIRIKPAGYYVGCNSDGSWANESAKYNLMYYGKMMKDNEKYILKNPKKSCQLKKETD